MLMQNIDGKLHFGIFVFEYCTENESEKYRKKDLTFQVGCGKIPG